MVWFKVDDTLAFHRKALAAGNAAMGVWVRAGSLCGQQLSDGHVTTDTALTIGTRAEIRRLVAAGLWHEPGHTCHTCPPVESGYLFHDWDDRNPTRAAIEAERERKRASGRAGGQASGRSRREARASALLPEVPEARANRLVDAESREAGHEMVSGDKKGGHETVTAASGEPLSTGHPDDAKRGGTTPDQALREARASALLPEVPNTRPDPTRPVLKAGQSGGGSPEPYATAEHAAAPPPPPNSTTTGVPRCTAHRHLPDDDPGPPCAGCRQARLAAERAQADTERAAQAAAAEAERARLAAIRGCGLCDGDGKSFTTNPRNGGLVRIDCDHQPEAASA